MSEVRSIPGLGTIYQRGKRLWIGYSANGRWMRESARTTVEREAIAFLKRRLVEVQSRTFIGAREARLQFGALEELLRRDYLQHQRRSIDTLPFRFKNLRKFFGSYRVAQITAAKINDYRALGLPKNAGGATINGELHAL